MDSSSSSPPTKPSNNPRPSMASTATTARITDHSLGSTIYGNWDQSSDIRNDLAAGWGEEEELVLGGSSSRTSMASAGGAQQQQQQPNNNNDMDEDNWGWKVNQSVVQPVPSFYPMDARSTRRITLSSIPTEILEDSVVEVGGGETSSSVVVDMDETEMGGLIDEDSSSSTPLPPTIEEVSNRISTACQSLSIYGIWDNNSSSATLCSMERVEMEINLYLDCDVVKAASTQQQQPVPQVLLVELQRRKGCSVTFHNYRRCLLDAAEGKFNPNTYNQTDGLDKPSGRDRCNQPRASLVDRPPVLAAGDKSSSFGSTGSSTIARPSGIMRPSLAKPSLSPGGGGEGLARPTLRSPSFSADDATMPIAGLKTEGDIEPPSPSIQSADIFEKSMKALNIAASLIRKDRVDARRLGMETLVLLTDPMRAGIETAKIASRVVLLGSACEDNNTMALETNNATADGSATDDVDALFDESSGLGIRETILEMIMTEGETQESIGDILSSDTDGFEGIEKEFTDSLFNLCLTVLSNALHTIEVSAKATSASPPPASGGQQQDGDDNDDNSEDGDRKPSPRRRAATEPVVRPSGEHGVSKRFIDDTNSTFGCDVLSSLIRILGQAKTNPHDAYHSARCLGVLFKGCGNSHKARARRDLDAKRIIAAALEVGARSHAKLADASRVAMVALVTDDEESMEEEETKTEMEEGEIVREEFEETAIDEEGQQQQQHLPSVLEHSQSSESDER